MKFEANCSGIFEGDYIKRMMGGEICGGRGGRVLSCSCKYVQ